MQDGYEKNWILRVLGRDEWDIRLETKCLLIWKCSLVKQDLHTPGRKEGSGSGERESLQEGKEQCHCQGRGFHDGPQRVDCRGWDGELCCPKRALRLRPHALAAGRVEGWLLPVQPLPQTPVQEPHPGTVHLIGSSLYLSLLGVNGVEIPTLVLKCGARAPPWSWPKLCCDPITGQLLSANSTLLTPQGKLERPFVLLWKSAHNKSFPLSSIRYTQCMTIFPLQKFFIFPNWTQAHQTITPVTLSPQPLLNAIFTFCLCKLGHAMYLTYVVIQYLKWGCVSPPNLFLFIKNILAILCSLRCLMNSQQFF